MARSAEPAATVVVATYNRSDRLRTAIKALEQQLGTVAFEVVVVDDCSPDDTWQVLQELAGSSPLDLKPRRLERNSGPATARNVGWREATAPIICFTDDDCEAQPGWIANLVDGMTDADVVQGRTAPNPHQLDRRGPFSHTITVYFEEGYYETCNIAYRRTLLEELGGFDETFRIAYGEDTDLAWRARERGARTAFREDALVFHEITPSRYRAFLRLLRRAPNLVRTFRNHPQAKRMLGKRVFFRPTHPRALLVVAAAVLVALRATSPLTWAAFVAVGLVYAWSCRRHHPKPRRKWYWLAVVPMALAADLYEIGVMAVASVRYRTLLL